MMRLPLLALLALAIAGCSDSGDSPAPDAEGPALDGSSATTAPPRAPQTTEVVAMDNAFSPRDITIRVGDSVRWLDRDNFNPHNVASSSPGNEFRSPDMDGALPTHAKEYTHTFDVAGTVDYVCDYHPGMVGSILVEA